MYLMIQRCCIVEGASLRALQGREGGRTLSDRAVNENERQRGRTHVRLRVAFSGRCRARCTRRCNSSVIAKHRRSKIKSDGGCGCA
jgi:hypothetical protein